MSPRGTRRLLAAVLATMALLSALGAAFAFRHHSDIQATQRARETGMRLFEPGQFEEALSPLNRYVATVKNDPEPMLAFAKCRLLVELPNQRHVDAAIAAAKLATDEAPDAWDA